MIGQAITQQPGRRISLLRQSVQPWYIPEAAGGSTGPNQCAAPAVLRTAGSI